MRFAAAWLLLCGVSFGQSLTSSRVVIATGYVRPQIVGDTLIYDESSKPVVQAAALITVGVPVGSKVFDIWADKIPSMDLADLALRPDGSYILTGEGKYRVTCYFEPKAIKRIEVDIGKAIPIPIVPVNPVQPVVPVPDVVPQLTDTALGSRQALLGFIASMAGNFDQLATDTPRFATVADASSANNAMDLLSRQKFKAAMADVMAPKLGNDKLPAHAAQVFREIGLGFRSVK